MRELEVVAQCLVQCENTMLMFTSWACIDLSNTPLSCEQEPLSTGKPVTVTNKIMVFFERYKQGIGVEMGLGAACRRRAAMHKHRQVEFVITTMDQSYP